MFDQTRVLELKENWNDEGVYGRDRVDSQADFWNNLKKSMKSKSEDYRENLERSEKNFGMNQYEIWNGTRMSWN